ncbi:MAG: VCBS repeat-containing protein [Acidobacteria bacterium]|nr:VCBS repeat-containing protein [Acidobacteriota bacterium]
MKVKIQRIKLIVLAAVAALTALTFALSPRLENPVHASEGGAPTGRTGAPGETTCTGCHSQNTGVGHLTVTAPANYTPGQTYTIQVQQTTTDTSRSNWGFEIISLTGTTMAGTFANTTANTRIRTASTKNYVTQTTAGTFPGQTGTATWTFNWTAPATNVGSVTFYAAGLQGDGGGDTGGDQTYTTSVVSQPQATVVIHHGFADFDADGKADASVFRPSTGVWYLNRSTAGFTAPQLGISTDKLVPADFDGDDKADLAVWREAAAGQAAFYILQSSTSTVRTELFGQTGDKPVAVGDWDGDGKADPAVYRDSAVGSQSYFYYRGSLNNPSGNVTYVPWGTTGDKPMRGDFDGDGKMDAAVFRAGVWYINQSSTGTLRTDYWGLATDKFVPADYDGDGKTDVAVFRAGVWYVKQSSTGTAAYYNWGLDTDVLVPADYDGDGKTDAAVCRSGIWYVRSSSTGSMSVQNFGLGTDTPIPSAFVQ